MRGGNREARLRLSSVQRLVQVVPVGVHVQNQTHLPRAPPMLHAALALERDGDLVMRFIPDKTFEAVARRESFDHAFPMFMNTPRQVARDPEIQRAIRTVRDDIHPARFHRRTLPWSQAAFNIGERGRISATLS